MTNLSKKILISTAIASLFLASSFAYAQGAIPDPLGGISFKDLLLKLVGIISGLLVGIASIMIIISGILFLIAGGNPGRMQTAKSALTYAILGLIVGLAADGIVTAVETTTGNSKDFSTLITNIGGLVSGITAGLATIMLIIAGIFYLFSLGDPGKMQTAKSIVIYAIIGIILGAAGGALIAFIQLIVNP